MRKVYFVDALTVVAALCLALVIKHDEFLPAFWANPEFHVSLGLVIGIQIILLFLSPINKTIWRFVSIKDAIEVVKASSITALISFATCFIFNRLAYIHRTVVVMDWILLTALLLAARFFARFQAEKDSSVPAEVTGHDRIVIVGAGVSGNNLLRDILRNPGVGKVVGFVDDDLGKKGRELQGFRVLGTIDELPSVCSTLDVSKVYIAIPSATGGLLEKIVEKCNQSDVVLKTLPKVRACFQSLAQHKIHPNKTIDKKLESSFSYLVAIDLNCFKLQNAFSTTCRPLYISLS